MSELADFRKAKDPYFGLAYYPENSELKFALAIEMATSTGDSQPYIPWRTISFLVIGQTATLTVYRGGDGE